MAELPLHLKQLEPLAGAWDILRYLYSLPGHSASVDEICDTLEMSDRRFGKANRRLVTTGYLAMQADFVYELTSKGIGAAEELIAYDATSPQPQSTVSDGIVREFLVAVPRVLVANKPAPVHLAFLDGDAFDQPITVALRIAAIHADLSSSDELLMLDGDKNQQTITLTPHAYNQVRLRVQVFQLSPDGDTVVECGGMYLDVDVQLDDAMSGLMAYGMAVEFTP